MKNIFRKKLFSILLIILSLSLLIGFKGEAISDKMIKITMNGKNMTVREVPIIMNGKIISSDTPSFLNVDRTLVPARLISENYGAKVGWDKNTETATINYNNRIVKLKINSNVAVIDGKNLKLDDKSIPRLVNFGGDSAVTMVPLTFLVEEVLGMETDWDYEKKAAYIKSTGKVEDIPNNIGGEDDLLEIPVLPNIKNTVKGTTIGDRNGKKVLVVSGTGKVKRNIINLENPSRMVIDLMDSELDGVLTKNYDYNVGVVKGVRMSQFVPDDNYKPEDRIVRIVLDMKSGEKNPNVKIYEEGNNLIIEPEETFWDNINYDKTSKTVTITNKEYTSYNVSYDNHKKRLEISVPSHSLDLNTGTIEIADSLLAEIETISSGSSTKVYLQFRRGINYKLLSSNPSNEIKISFSKDEDIRNSDRIIVIDPGHGGSDPGASAGGLKEKDLTLAISLDLESKLSRLGYNVEMTRNTDKAVGLKDRVKISNNLYPDIFVSIHGNSATVSSAAGIETLYAPNSNKFYKGDQQTTLAKFVQEELIRATGASDRKIKQRPNLVVIRDTDSPAILVEVGFISNPGELSKLKDRGYQEKISEAIVKGIERYFEIY